MKISVMVSGKTVVEVRKRIPCTPPAVGFMSVADGHEEITYDVAADSDLLELMAKRAARNTRGHSVDGPLSVRVTGRRKL